MFYGEMYQFGAGLYIKLIHHFIFVKFHRLCRNVQNRCGFFSRFALGQELQNFTLTRAYFFK